MVRHAAKTMAFLVCVDGLASDVTAFTRVFRDPVRPGKAGRPRLAAIPGLLLGQVLKHHAGRRLVSVTRRVVLGTAAAVAATLTATGTGTGINMSYIARLNAPFRAALCPLVRRGRALVRGEGVLTGWMSLVGCAYNFCWDHDSLRVAAPPGERLQGRGSDSGDGGRPDGPSMDHVRTVELPDPVAPLGRPHAPGTPAEAISGTQGGPSMFTVPWGATRGIGA